MSPKRFLGWEPSTTTVTLPDGRQRTTREPEWDAYDRHIIREWKRLLANQCEKCGRPWAIHKDDRPEDYGVGAFTCTATVALDRQQAALYASEEHLRKRGINPDRARQWTTWTAAEGRPEL